MGYFRRLSDALFKTDSHGNTIFYPWGMIGKGYVLPDRQTEDKVRRFVIWYHFTVLVTLLFVGAFLGLWIVNLIVVLPVVIILWGLIVKRFTKGLQPSDKKLTFSENFKKMFGRYNS